MIFDKIFGHKPEYFLVVNLFPKSCNLATFFIVDHEVQVTNSTFYRFSANENLTSVIRRFLDSTGINPNNLKVVFGLPSFWIEGEQVKPEFEKFLLATTEELGLTPMAFISSTAALGFYKYWQDPNLKNFYIVELFSKKILAEEVENGELINSAVEDFDDLVNFDFSKIFNKTQVTENTFNFQQVTASETETEEDFKTPPPAGEGTIKSESGESQQEENEGKILIFGFVEENNLEALSQHLNQFFQKTTVKCEIFPIEAEDFAKSLSTAVAHDLGQLPTPAPIQPEEQVQSEEEPAFGFVHGTDVGQHPDIETERLPPASKLAGILKSSQLFAQSFLSNFRKAGRRRLLVVLGLVLVVGLFLTYWFLPSANIELLVNSSAFSQDFSVVASPTTDSIDVDAQIVPGQTITVTREASKKTVTTGKQKVGEKATGQVTIFNKTTAPKTFQPGIKILGPANQTFVLTESVVVASRSASLEGITYGKATTNVEAVEIGESGNLSPNTDFTFAEFDISLYSAHSDEAFTGGTAKEINIVSAEDRQRLESELVKELTDSAKTELVQLAAGKKLEDEAIVAKPERLQFDKEVGSQANILELTAKINFTATLFSLKDIENVVRDKLKTELPPNLSSLQNTKIETQVEEVKNDGSLSLRVGFEADLVPEIDKKEITTAVAGKSIDFSKSYLLNIEGVQNVNINLRPQLPSFLATMPRASSRINIEVKAKE